MFLLFFKIKTVVKNYKQIVLCILISNVLKGSFKIISNKEGLCQFFLPCESNRALKPVRNLGKALAYHEEKLNVDHEKKLEYANCLLCRFVFGKSIYQDINLNIIIHISLRIRSV